MNAAASVWRCESLSTNVCKVRFWETIDMPTWFKQLDKILRGDATRMSSLVDGEIKIPVGGLSIAVLLLGVLYGFCVGSFAMIQTAGEAYRQFIAGAFNPRLPL